MSAAAAIHYVNVSSTSPAPPYTNWTTAATAIQEAVDAAVSGDQILVTNGVYQTGRRVGSDGSTNRVTVNKAVTVHSVNGAAVTLIQGDHAMRCVYLTNGAALVGFTLTNGVAYTGGGAWCESPSAVVSNCVLIGNSASFEGGGAYGCTLNNCTLTGNSAAYDGGGASGGTLNNCTLTGNSASNSGGGASGGTLNNCVLVGNSASVDGGGASFGTLNNCTLTANSASQAGGASTCTLDNCIVYYNSAPRGDNYADDGSFYPSVFSYSCTTPLPAGGLGNISAEPQLADLSHLSAGSPCRGAGNAAYATGLDIDGETWANPPSIGCDEYHPSVAIGPLSVSVQAAYTNVAVGFAVNFTTAINGRAAANGWEFGDGTVVSNRTDTSHSWAVAGNYLVVFTAYNDTHPGGMSATVTVQVVAQPVHYVTLASANPVAPYTTWATAATNIQDVVDAASVAGALVLVTNGVYQTGGRVVSEIGAIKNRVAVTKALIVQSVNGAEVTMIQGQGVTRCVYLASGAALVGFTLANGDARGSGYSPREWSGGGVWCESPSAVVSNCTLSSNSAFGGGGAYGGTLFNCALVANSAVLGGGASGSRLYNCTISDNSCADVDSGGGGVAGCTLNNCTLARNSGSAGGGAYDSTLNNCTLTANSAAVGGWRAGGGAYESTLNNCTLTANSTDGGGGGVVGGTLNNCTLTANSADQGGGAYNSTLNNCIVYFNSAQNGDNYYYSRLSYSCTTPLPPGGVGNISAEPLLTDLFHLSAGSLCRGAGSATYASGMDIDGETWANPPSIGCDEYTTRGLFYYLRFGEQLEIPS
jgi:hypothetical protein